MQKIKGRLKDNWLFALLVGLFILFLVPMVAMCFLAVPASDDFVNASIMRESSPPDAIFASGFGSSPGFVEIKNSTVSCPWEDSGPRVCLSAKRMPGRF